MISEKEYALVKEYLEKTAKAVYHPTDEEVIALCNVYQHMMDMGHLFGQEVITAWAIMNMQSWRSIAFARNLEISK